MIGRVESIRRSVRLRPDAVRYAGVVRKTALGVESDSSDFGVLGRPACGNIDGKDIGVLMTDIMICRSQAGCRCSMFDGATSTQSEVRERWLDELSCDVRMQRACLAVEGEEARKRSKEVCVFGPRCPVNDVILCRRCCCVC